MPSRFIDLPQGTLDLLILRTLSLEPLHGWAVSERIQQISSDVLRVQQGSLYPALHRLERRGSDYRQEFAASRQGHLPDGAGPDGRHDRQSEPL